MTFRQPVIRPASSSDRRPKGSPLDTTSFGIAVLALIAAGLIVLAMASAISDNGASETLIEEQKKTRELLCLVMEVQEYELGPELREACENR